jgi:hypothetical protein
MHIAPVRQPIGRTGAILFCAPQEPSGILQVVLFSVIDAEYEVGIGPKNLFIHPGKIFF